MNSVQVVDFEGKYSEAFKQLNINWITKYFVVEPLDVEVLSNPNELIERGGFIFVALFDKIPIGVCALKKMDDTKFELCKFAVDEKYTGLGIGKVLMEACISKSKNKGIQTLYLEGNTKLSSSIHLYRKYGFKEIPLQENEAHYDRVDIIMELDLK